MWDPTKPANPQIYTGKKKSLPGNIVKILHKFGFFNSIIIIKKCDYLLICRFVSFEHTLKLHDSIVLYQIARIANMPNTLQFHNMYS